MEILQNIVTKDKGFLEKCDNNYKIIEQECDKYFEEINYFLKTGNANYFGPINENVEPASVSSKRKGRQKKHALADITENNVPQTEIISIKKEKISDINEEPEEFNSKVPIKKEVEEMPAPTKLPPRKKKIKIEKPDLPTRSTRSKKFEGSYTISPGEGTRSTKDSDIIIQNTTVTTIDISDSEKETDSEVEKYSSQTETRTTRSKMRKPAKSQVVENAVKELSVKECDGETNSTIESTQTKTKQKKRARSNSLEKPSVQTENKKSRSDSNSEKDLNGSVQTEYEDAVSAFENNQDKPKPVDATYIASPKNSQINNEHVVDSNINSTIVVENPKIVRNEKDQPPQNNLEEIPRTPPKSITNKGSKQIFSPFEKTPLKKKIEAFERLGAESSGIPTRVTRTKKKAQKKDGEHDEEGERKSDEKNKKCSETYKTSNKALTPMTSKFIPKVCSTSKINKLHPAYSNETSTNNENILSVKSASALKASQAEFRDREKRRKEKERETLKKREALLKAQSDEKRRKREEKQMKAQQQREILEKEIQKQLEVQRIKEEKFKQAMAEKEKKLQRQKEEAEKRRLLAKQKAIDLLKEKEEAMKIIEQKKNAEMKAALDKQGEMAKLAAKQKTHRSHQPSQQSLPIYMTTKPPLLPTEDCYDSDDPARDPKKRIDPAWSKDMELREIQLAMITVGETIKNSFFCRQAQTPDLQEIFELIDPRKLKRTSSAIWRKPPRYTLMPVLEDTIEFSEESD